MALQVWLPLTNANRIQNHGLLGDLSITTTPSIIAGGKLGGTLNGGGYKMSADQTKMCLNNKEFSCAFWVKVTSSAERKMFFGNDGPRQFSIFNYPTINDLHLSWANSAETNTLSTVDSGVFPTNVWTHCCVTYNNPIVTVYINGGVLKTYSYTCDITDFAKETQVIHSATGRYLNDFRIYNHCLSPKEVKEISKGLVLHYPMNNCSIDANNLLNNASLYREETPYKCSTTSTDGYFHTNMYYNNDSLGGQTVTFSVSTNKQIAPSHGGSSATHDKVGLWLYLKKTAYSSPDGSYDSPINLNSSNNNFKSLGNNRYSWTYTIPSGYKGLMIRTNLYSNNGSSVSADFWDFQLEFGSKASPFNPNKWTSTTVYDCSGFGYNGVAYGNLITDSDTSRYSSSIKFPATTTDYIEMNNSSIFSALDNCTISWWGKYDGARSLLLTGQDTSYFVAAGGPSFYHSNVAGALSYYVDGTKLSSVPAYTSGQWHHYTITGVNITSWTKFLLNHYENYTEWGIQGKISDFRIYATPLSAESVKELYNTSTVICDNGTVMAYSLEE